MSTRSFPFWALVASTSAVAAPLEIESSGRLLDASGSPVNGERALGFALHDAETDGTLLWSDTFTVAIEDGYYTVRLGSGSQVLELADFSGATPWLQVSVGGTPIGGRTELASAPFALVSASGSSSEGTERVTVFPACTVASCAIEGKSDGVLAVDRNGVGSYTIRFASGTFHSTPACSVMVDGLGRVANLSPLGRSATAFSFYTGTSAGVATDFGFSALCVGKRVAAAPTGTGCLTSGSQAFEGTGATQNFTVPAGCTRVDVYAWGAGGSGGRGLDYNANGGGGGFVNAVVEVNPLETLTVIVGKGGARGVTPGGGVSTSAFGGGGASGDGYTGGGGGRSAIRRGTDELITAGGGGGGGAALSSGYGAGGAGGGATGTAGGNYAATTTGGGGGTQTAGGAGGVASSGGTSGNAGSAFQGGNSAAPTGHPGGGGGGGWYGGGSGGHTPGSQASGGGGGSSHLGTGATGTLHAGTGTAPGGAGESLRNGAADGGVSPNYGDDGRIVIVWAP